MEVNINIDPADPITLLYAIIITFGLQLWGSWFQRQMTLQDEKPELAQVRIKNLVAAVGDVVLVMLLIFMLLLTAWVFIYGLIYFSKNNYVAGIQLCTQSIGLLLFTSYKIFSRLTSKSLKIVGTIGGLIVALGGAISGIPVIVDGEFGMGIFLITSNMGFFITIIETFIRKNGSKRVVYLGLMLSGIGLLSAGIASEFIMDISLGVVVTRWALVGMDIIPFPKFREAIRVIIGELIAFFGFSIILTNFPLGLLTVIAGYGFILGGAWFFIGMGSIGLASSLLGVSTIPKDILGGLISIISGVGTIIFNTIGILKPEKFKRWKGWIDYARDPKEPYHSGKSRQKTTGKKQRHKLIQK